MGLDEHRVTAELEMSRTEIRAEMREAQRRVNALDKRSRELGTGRTQLQADLDAALIEQNRVEFKSATAASGTWTWGADSLSFREGS